MPWKGGYWIAPEDRVGPEFASERVAQEYARELNAKRSGESFNVRSPAFLSAVTRGVTPALWPSPSFPAK